jgi:exodeoxyribonuclease V gamma subunit
VRLLAATAAQPERPLEAVTIGRGGDEREPVRCARIPPLAGDPAARAEHARTHLAEIVDVYRRGMREPLPLYCATSAAYAEARHKGRDPQAAVRRAWESGYKFDGEDKDKEHQLVLGGQPAATELFTELPRGDEHGPGWPDDEPSRFGRCARRLWDGLLALEEVTSR